MKTENNTSIKAVVAWLLLALLLVGTDPTKLPMVFLIAPFIVLYVAVSSTLRAIFQRNTASKVEQWLPTVVAICSVVIVSLQSIGQLTVRDVIAVLLLVVVGYFFIHRNKPASKQ